MDLASMLDSAKSDELFDEWFTGAWGGSLMDLTASPETHLVEQPWAYGHGSSFTLPELPDDVVQILNGGHVDPDRVKLDVGVLGAVNSTNSSSFHHVDSRFVPTAVKSEDGGGNEKVKPQKPVKKQGQQQRRFRARQKAQMSQLEKEVQEKLRQLELLVEENKKLKQKTGVLETIISSREEHLNLLSKHGPPPTCEESTLDLAPRGRVIPLADAPGSIPPEFARQVTVDELRDAWKRAVFKFSTHMLAVERPEPDPVAVQQVSTMITNVSSNFKTIAMVNPCVVYKVKALNVDTGAVEAPPYEFWVKVAYMVQNNMTDQMKNELRQCYDKYQEGMQRLLVERKALMKEFNALQNCSKGVCPLHFDEVESFSLPPLLEQLQKNLKSEHVYTNMLACFTVQLFPPIMKARIWFHAFPYFPEIITVATLLANEGVVEMPKGALMIAGTTSSDLSSPEP